MAESDSDIVLCSSKNSTLLEHEMVPESKDFKFKFFGPSYASNGVKLAFKLNEGRSLQYLTKLTSSKSKGVWVKIS